MFLGFKGFLCRKYTNWILVIQTGGGKSSGGRDPGLLPGLGSGDKRCLAVETLDGGWELVGVKLPALETLRRGKRMSASSFVYRLLMSSPLGWEPVWREISGTRDLTPGI
jgi:hypothetical protein